MQAEVTVVLATVWLVVSVGVEGAATHHPSHLTHDQYSPLPPYQDEVYPRVEDQLDWKDQDPPKDQSLDPSIAPRRTISRNESPVRVFEADLRRRHTLKNNEFSLLNENKEQRNLAGSKFRSENRKNFEKIFSQELPPSEFDDPFVADDNFQDQGPGSVEIYKLDLHKETALLNPTSATKSPVKNKSKAPKKTSHINWKTKTPEYKTTSPKFLQKQSNLFGEVQTEIPPNSKLFEIGGVPELQVGCEGLEAPFHKQKRSIDTPTSDQSRGTDFWAGITPVSLDLDDELSMEESYEEMDELFKLKKLETTTEGPKYRRGDMEATLNSDDSLNDRNHSDKLPVRGDLGKSTDANQSTILFTTPSHDKPKTGSKESLIGSRKNASYDRRAKRDLIVAGQDTPVASDGVATDHGRRLLWLQDSNGDEHANEQKRLRRRIWGFGEDEGVISSDEVQSEHERRRQEYERQRQEHDRRRLHEQRIREEEARRRHSYNINQSNVEAEKIREEYERMLQEKEREEQERQHRLQAGSRKVAPNTWENEERRKAEERRREEEHRRRTSQPLRSQIEDEERQRRLQHEEMSRRHNWQDEERRRQELGEFRRRQDHRARPETTENLEGQRAHEEELRRREQKRLQEEQERERQRQMETRQRIEGERRRQEEEDERIKARNRWYQENRDEEERRRESGYKLERNLRPEDRRHLEERQRAWLAKQREEEERLRQGQNGTGAPSNLYQFRSQSSATETNRRRGQEEREREEQLREYIERNRPININSTADPRRDEVERRRMEEERRRYRNQDRHDSRENSMRGRGEEEAARRRAEEQRRRTEEERKLQEYIRRNQPVHVQKTNDSYYRDWIESRRTINEARQYTGPGYRDSGSGRRNHGPSAPTNIDPRSYVDDNKRTQEARRLEEERRVRERQRQEEEDRRREAMRHEMEARRMQSRRYEEERKRLEAAELDAERKRQELIEEEKRRSHGGWSKPLENTRPDYQEHRRLEQHRRRQDTSLIPGNLLSDDLRRGMERERQRQDQEKRRQQTERRKLENEGTIATRQKEEHARGMDDQWKRREEARLNALPVSARIILSPGASSHIRPPIFSRGGFENEIDFSGINPNRNGVQASRFPAAVTARPPAKSPGPCVWAVVQCCPSNNNRLVTCFESMGCPGINWDPNPCRGSIADAAREEVMKFYAAAEADDQV